MWQTRRVTIQPAHLLPSLRADVARALLIAVLPACGSQCDDPLPGEAELCFDDVTCDPEVPAGLLELGDRSGHAFRAWEEDDSVPVAEGGQGGFMILPHVCVPAPASAPADACLLVQLDNAFDRVGEDGGADGDADADAGGEGDGEDEGGVHARYRFQLQGERLCAGPIYDLLTYSTRDLAAGGVTIDADVCGLGDLHGASTRHLTLSPP